MKRSRNTAMFQHLDNRLTHPCSILVNIIIGKAQNPNAQRVKIRCAGMILFCFLWFEVLRTIQFYHKFCFVTIEICYIAANNFLPAKTRLTIPQAIVPQVSFLPRHIFPEGSGIGDQTIIPGVSHTKSTSNPSVWNQ